MFKHHCLLLNRVYPFLNYEGSLFSEDSFFILIEAVCKYMMFFSYIEFQFYRFLCFQYIPSLIFNLFYYFPHFHRFTRGTSIGLLDMSGFENFVVNGFDQFLINVTNEKLQQYFMEYIFPREKRDYEAEGIHWAELQYHNNEDVLEMIFQASSYREFG